MSMGRVGEGAHPRQGCLCSLSLALAFVCIRVQRDAFRSRSTLHRLRVLYEFLKRHNRSGGEPGPGAGAAAGASAGAAAGAEAATGVVGGGSAGPTSAAEGEGLRHRRLGGHGSTSGIVPLDRVDGRALLTVYRQGGSSWLASSSAPKSLMVLVLVILLMVLFTKKLRHPDLYM